MRRAAAVGAVVVVAVLVAAVALVGPGGRSAAHPRRHVLAAPIVRRDAPRRVRHAVASHVALLSAEASRRARVPILMFHVVSAPAPGAPNRELYVGAARFAAEVRALGRAGFHAVTLSRAFAAWHGTARLPHHPIVMSFDDGYISDWSHAAPVLRAAGWPGVLNLELANLHGKGSLKAGQVRRMVRAGWEVASHTLTHPDLTQVGAGRLRTELVGSRAAIRRLFGMTPRFFCYPAGRFDARVVAAVAAAGYGGATTELPGAATATSDPYRLPRVRVNGSDTPAALVARVRALAG